MYREGRGMQEYAAKEKRNKRGLAFEMSKNEGCATVCRAEKIGEVIIQSIHSYTTNVARRAPPHGYSTKEVTIWGAELRADMPDRVTTPCVYQNAVLEDKKKGAGRSFVSRQHKKPKH